MLLESLRPSQNIEDWRGQNVATIGPGAPNWIWQRLMQPQSQGLLSALLGFNDIPSASLLGQLRGDQQRGEETKAQGKTGLKDTQSEMGEALRKHGQRRLFEQLDEKDPQSLKRD
jgi:hypothetical protein